MDGSDPRLVYEPAEAWGHFCTQTAGSSVTFKFNGRSRTLVHRAPRCANVDRYDQVSTVLSTDRPARRRHANHLSSTTNQCTTSRVQETRRTYPSRTRASITAHTHPPLLSKAPTRRCVLTSYNFSAPRNKYLLRCRGHRTPNLAHSHPIILLSRLPHTPSPPVRSVGSS